MLVQAVLAPHPAGGHTLDSIGAMLAKNFAETLATKQEVAVNTNTTNISAAAVKKMETQVNKVESDLTKLSRRDLSLAKKDDAKGAATGGGRNAAVFPMSPRACPDPLQTHDPWLGSDSRAAGLGFAPCRTRS